jgi:hypothetical protein
MARAIKKSVHRDKYFTQIEYEYRGCRYEVEYANGWQVCSSPAWYQHKIRQEEIDEMIDNPKPAPEKNHKTAMEEMDEIWEMMGW